MAFYSIPLKAGVAHVQDVPGSLILVDGIDGAAGVDVTPIVNGSRQTTMPARKAGFKYRTQYDAVELVAAADCQVRIFLTTNDVTLGFTDGAMVNVIGAVQVTNGSANRLPVDLANGTVNVQATNVGINNTDATAVPVRQRAGDNFIVDSKLGAVFMVSPDAAAMFKVDRKRLATVVDVGVVAVGVARVQLVADNTLERVRFRNTHATAQVAIGGAGVTLANAAVVLQPGDVWNEEDAPGATWYAISDTAATNVAITGLKP